MIRAMILGALVTGCGGGATITSEPAAQPTRQPSPSPPDPSPTTTPTADVSLISTDPDVARARVEDGLPLFEYDASADLELERGDPISLNGPFLVEISYASPAGGRVPGYLMLPGEIGAPAPGLIIQHGMPGHPRDMFGVARSNAAAGVVSLLIEAPWGRDGREGAGAGEVVTFTAQDRAEQIQLIVDLRRAVDVLEQIPEVDGDRIGYIGYSYGAAMGALLAGVEPRIRAFHLMVGDGGLVEHFIGGGQPSALDDLPEAQREEWIEAMEPIEPLYFISNATAPLFFQNARADTAVDANDAERLHAAAPDERVVEWYDSGHNLPREAFCDGAQWLGDLLAFDGSADPTCEA